jgi:OPA family glycerol-3-phosphate transporter-like MFS transporter
MIVSGMALSSACNIGMTFLSGGSAGALCAVWGANGVAQSAIWAPMIRILAQVLSPERRFKASVNILATVPAGTLFTYFLATVSLRFLGWKSVFYSGGSIVALGAFVMLIYYIKNKKYLIAGLSAQIQPEKNKRAGGGIKAIFAVLLIPALPVMLHGMLKDSITTWFPVYLTENFEVAPYAAVLLTTLLPVVNLAGVYSSKKIYGKMKSNELLTCAVMYASCVLGFLFMFLFGRLNLYLAAVAAAMGTASMAGINVMLISVLPMRFGKTGAVSTVTGTLNSVTYAGASVSMVGSGALVDIFGWAATIGVWCLLAAFGLILCLLLRKSWSKNIT